MTTANKVTIGRMLLIPFFVVHTLYYVNSARELHRYLAIIAFAVAAGCDAVDGFIARRFNQHSELGKILDPLADKLLLVSGIVLLSFDHEPVLARLPVWLATTAISRDILLLVGLVVITHVCGKVKVRPVLLGKAATVLQMGSVLWTLLKWDVTWLLAWAVAAAVCTGLSGLIYVWDGVRQLSASPASFPSKGDSEK
jgi:cardiolipin synthase (CMP-forming)